MILKTLSMVLVLSFLAGAGTAWVQAMEDDPEPQACPSVTSQRVVKLAGQTSGYPASCALPVCRIMNSTAIKTHLEGMQGLPGGYITVVDWRYKVQLGAVPSNACPADVVAGPWVQP